jgi:hypothetical protein
MLGLKNARHNSCVLCVCVCSQLLDRLGLIPMSGSNQQMEASVRQFRATDDSVQKVFGAVAVAQMEMLRQLFQAATQHSRGRSGQLDLGRQQVCWFLNRL